MNNQKLFFKHDQVGFVLCAALLGTLTGCVAYVDRPQPGSVYVVPRVVEPVVVVQDDYIYYPSYEVYYSSSRRQYAYRDEGGWVSRPAPRGVSVDVLFASPSVRMSFHDAPEHHHAAIVRQYPRNWSPSAQNQERKENRKDDHRDQRDQRRDNNGR